MSARLTPAESARREDWIRYLAKQGYNRRQISERLAGYGNSPSSISGAMIKMGITVSRTGSPDLPMNPLDWRNEPVPGSRQPSRLERDGIIIEPLALLEFLEKEEALFRLATLAEEGELDPEQYAGLLRLRDYLDDMLKAIRSQQFRAEIRKNPLKYRSR